MRLVLFVATAVIVADRVSKVLILEYMAPGQRISIFPDFFSLVHIRNPGAAFGFLSQLGTAWREPFLIGVSLVAIAGLSYLVYKTPRDRHWERVAAAAVIGGAIGNLYDRIAYGEVIDFLDVYVRDWHWPAFNVADSAITVGVAILVIASTFGRHAEVDGGADPTPVD